MEFVGLGSVVAVERNPTDEILLQDSARPVSMFSRSCGQGTEDQAIMNSLDPNIQVTLLMCMSQHGFSYLECSLVFTCFP